MRALSYGSSIAYETNALEQLAVRGGAVEADAQHMLAILLIVLPIQHKQTT